MYLLRMTTLHHILLSKKPIEFLTMNFIH